MTQCCLPPGYGPLLQTSDMNEFKEALERLGAKAGGDHEELGFRGMLEALYRVAPGSQCYVFTDAPPRDQHLKPAVLGLATHKQVAVS